MLTSPPASPLLGARRPRVELGPCTAATLGPITTELAARAGLVLEPWQSDALDLMLAVRPDGLWACPEYAEVVARQNGKGAVLEARVLAGLFLFGERLIMWSAHLYDTAMEAFARVERLIDTLVEQGQIEPVKVIRTNGKEAFVLPGTGQRLKFIARSKSAGRGFTGDVNVIDEAFAYTRAQQAALMPTMSARPNPQVIYMSTPPLDGESGEPLFDLRDRALAGDPALGWRDWGAEGDLDQVMRLPAEERRAWLDDLDRWAATNPALGGGRMTAASIERNRRSLSDLDCAREIFGVWPMRASAGGGVISRRVWDPLADEDSTLVGEVAFGIDANPERTAAAIGVAGHRGDGLEHVEVVEQFAGLAGVVARAVALEEQHGPLGWVIDPNGPAGSLIAELEAEGIVVETVTGAELGRACGDFYDAVAQARLRHLGDPVLDGAVDAGRKRDIGDGVLVWGRKNSGANIAPLVAVTLARHGLVTAVDLADNAW